MIHDDGLGRETDVSKQIGKEAYNPYTGNCYNPKTKDSNYVDFMENLRLRDDMRCVRAETIATLPDMVQAIRTEGRNVLLELDFKDKAAVEPSYWALKSMTNAAGVPANEWCIYKLQTSGVSTSCKLM